MKTLNKRFWSKVNKTDDGCWFWTGGTHKKKGHGLIYTTKEDGTNTTIQAPRYSYELVHGATERSTEISQTCGNPLCVNPEHLVAASTSDEERFWGKVDKSAGPDGCWLWTAGCFDDGYGQFWCGSTNLRAHRYAYELINDSIPGGLLLRHSCDNRLCVNPTHLTPGTELENSRDMVERGRSLLGERHHKAKLSEEDVKFIREVVASGPKGTAAKMARLYGLTKASVSAIVNNKSWKHIT